MIWDQEREIGRDILLNGPGNPGLRWLRGDASENLRVGRPDEQEAIKLPSLLGAVNGQDGLLPVASGYAYGALCGRRRVAKGLIGENGNGGRPG